LASTWPLEASFDTNILIDSLNGDRRARFELVRTERRWISRATWIEVMSKVEPDEEAVLADFFADFTIEEITVPIARRAAALRFARPKLKLPDAIIQATALHGNRTLVTRNTKDFPPGTLGIHIPYTLHD
jgi:predicted nucleic acid-binding protein